MRKRSIGRFPRSMAAASLIATLLAAGTAGAAGTVNSCTESSLVAALAGGGLVSFACDGTIPLTSTKTLTASTTLDATGRNVALSGAGVRQIFVVNGGSQFRAIHVVFQDGSRPTPRSRTTASAGAPRGAPSRSTLGPRKS